MFEDNNSQEAGLSIHVIALESQEDCDEVLRQGERVFRKNQIEVQTKSEEVPGIVGALEGFVGLIQAVGPAVGSAFAGAIAGATVQEFVAWLKKRGKSPRINSDAAEAIAQADLETNINVTRYKRVKRRVFPDCDKAITTPKNCFVFVFEEIDSKAKHTYVISNEGEITSYEGG